MGKTSERQKVSVGVPQGSILGPLLFTIFINDLPLSVTSNSNLNMYADDQTLLSSGFTISQVNNLLQNDANAVNNWITGNGMLINANKTKVMLVGSRHKLHNVDRSCDKIDVIINDISISCVNFERSLGVTIDDVISWNKHIDNMCITLSQRIGLLRRLHKLIPFHLRKILYYGLIQSILDYCCVVWGNTSKTNIDRVYKMQKRALRVLLNADFDTPSNDLFKAADVLSVKQRIFYFTCILVFKYFENSVPTYIADMFMPLMNVHDYPTRAAISRKLLLPQFRTESGQRTFVMRASRIWNSLPENLRCSPSLSIFKIQLKVFIKDNIDI